MLPHTLKMVISRNVVHWRVTAKSKTSFCYFYTSIISQGLQSSKMPSESSFNLPTPTRLYVYSVPFNLSSRSMVGNSIKSQGFCGMHCSIHRVFAPLSSFTSRVASPIVSPSSRRSNGYHELSAFSSAPHKRRTFASNMRFAEMIAPRGSSWFRSRLALTTTGVSWIPEPTDGKRTCPLIEAHDHVGAVYRLYLHV